ncbi:hypothetical protein HanXRQr2_Chr05g0229221 [Helianthus annuus]|uniref:Uncharacterized protein n=1 Tax=Helianthus annuus TaxID=4232 RepID=A0A9K3J1A9_HELAN|nr:hypothetical protein HanXRQr2_Chr05g0229221 [Helianthus annuus]KAJ0923822.1 hypothetical protein HanPSC8_Chr05g0221131 [Helianthus annuus]
MSNSTETRQSFPLIGTTTKHKEFLHSPTTFRTHHLIRHPATNPRKNKSGTVLRRML